MKSILLVSALFLSFATSAQITPPKGSNVAIVTLPDSAAAGWRRVGSALVSSGFAIKNSNESLLTLTTEPKPANPGTQVSLSASVKGNKATLRGTVTVATLSSAPSTLAYKGMKGGAYMLGWQQLDKVVKALGGTVVYEKE